MWPTLKPSQRVSVLGVVNPQSATTVQVTGWLSAKNFLNYLVIVNVGVISASGTVDAKIQQAQDSSGTGAKDITGKAITQLTQAGANGNSQCMINLKQDDFDVTNNFCFFQVSVTPAAAAALIGMLVLGVDPAMGFATDSDLTSVAQVVG